MSRVLSWIKSIQVTSCHVMSCHVMSRHVMSIIIWLFVLVGCVHAKGSKDYDTLSYPISQSSAAAYQKGGHAYGELDWRLCWCWQRNLICPPATLVSQIVSFVMSVRLLTVYSLPLFKCNSVARSWTMVNSVNVSTQYSFTKRNVLPWFPGSSIR